VPPSSEGSCSLARDGALPRLPPHRAPPAADMEPAQDEDDLYDLLHDEIAASRSRPRPGGAEDDEGQRQDTKVRATPPPQAASDARPTGGPVARSG